MSARTLINGFALALSLSALGGVVRAADVDVAAGSTIIVDDTWWLDVDFLDIPPAVAAARPGDRIIVRSGAYSGFTLFEGIKVLGESGVKVQGDIVVSDLPPGRRAILAGMSAEGVVITRCESPVILQDIQARRPAAVFGETSHVRITQCVDVRIRRSTIGGPTGLTPRLIGLFVSGSRLELTDSLMTGENGMPAGLGQRDGVPGLLIEGGAEVHVSRTTIVGGYGGSGATGGDGANAVEVVGEGSTLFMTGTVGDVILGGAAGVGESCDSDGRPSSAIHIGPGAFARVSGVDLRQGDDHGCGGAPIGVFDVEGTLVEPDPADPTLRLLGSPGAGHVASFVFTASPGAIVELNLGRRPVVEDVANIDEDLMLKVLQTINLGVVPDSGQVRFQIGLAASNLVASGRLLMAQGSVTDGRGKRLTQSIPLVIQ